MVCNLCWFFFFSLFFFFFIRFCDAKIGEVTTYAMMRPLTTLCEVGRKHRHGVLTGRLVDGLPSGSYL